MFRLHRTPIFRSLVETLSTRTRYPLGLDSSLSELYSDGRGGLRSSLLLQDIDQLGYNACVQHHGGPSGAQDFRFVTGTVEHVSLSPYLTDRGTYTLRSGVTRTSRSTMTVDSELRDESEALLGFARYVWVALGPDGRGSGAVPPLSSVPAPPPALEHLLADPSPLDATPGLETAIPVSLALLVGPHHRNMHGMLSGGFALTLAVDHAITTCASNLGHPDFALREVDEAVFRREVSLGEVLRLDGRLMYYSGSSKHVGVTARTSDAGAAIDFQVTLEDLRTPGVRPPVQASEGLAALQARNIAQFGAG